MKPKAHDAATLNDDGAIASFYHLRSELTQRCCKGLACFAARADNRERWAMASADTSPVYCLGKCYAAPATTEDDVDLHIECRAREQILLGRALQGDVHTLTDYCRSGGLAALAKVLREAPSQAIDVVTASGLRGRGGAGFLTGRKWAAVAKAKSKRKYVVANADEGDPGSFSDRLLMENDPFLLIEGMLIAAHAIGAHHGYIYLRKEYPRANERLRTALSEARAEKMLGESALGPGHEFDIDLIVGQGSYLCGEETAMLNAIEGKRPEARSRPPFIFEHGLFGAPTLVNNVETLCAVPWILNRGADAYATLGFSRSRGTKLLSLSSLFNRPGLYEVEFGISLRDVVYDLGGGVRNCELRALMIGGPLAGLIPPRLLGTRLGYEELQAIGAAVGHGGVIAFGADTSIAEIAYQVFRFGTSESCGRCAPCHRGSPFVERLFASAAASRRPQISARAYGDVIHAMEAASLCGHGRGLAEFARSLERHFPEELASCFA